MRSIEEVKADMDKALGCMYNRNNCNNDCAACDYLNYDNNFFRLKKENYEAHIDAEKRQKAILSIDTDRLEAICAAEREGRAVVLPCAKRETVYTASSNGALIRKWKVVSFHILSEQASYIDVEMEGQPEVDRSYYFDDFGKSVFLTRKQAAASLQKSEECVNGATRAHVTRANTDAEAAGGAQ